MILSGEKTEEYREIKPYWIKRLCDDHEGCIGGDFMDPHVVMAYTFKSFTYAQFRNGYSKDSRNMLRRIYSIEIDTGNPEWGAEPGKKYFVIKLGEQIHTHSSRGNLYVFPMSEGLAVDSATIKK